MSKDEVMTLLYRYFSAIMRGENPKCPLELVESFPDVLTCIEAKFNALDEHKDLSFTGKNVFDIIIAFSDICKILRLLWE